MKRMITNQKGFFYIILAIIIYSLRQFLFMGYDRTSPILGLTTTFLTLVALFLLIAGIKIFFSKKSDQETTKETNNLNILTKKEKFKYTLIVILGLLLSGSIYYLPKILCENYDFVCGSEYTGFGIILTAIGLWLLIYGLKKISKTLNKKIF